VLYILYCNGLSGDPPKRYVCVLTLITWEYDLIWKKGLCRCHEVKDLMMSSFWISQVALNPVTDVPIRGRRGEDIDSKVRALKEGQSLKLVSHVPRKPLEAGRGKGHFFP